MKSLYGYVYMGSTANGVYRFSYCLERQFVSVAKAPIASLFLSLASLFFNVNGSALGQMVSQIQCAAAHVPKFIILFYAIGRQSTNKKK